MFDESFTDKLMDVGITILVYLLLIFLAFVVVSFATHQLTADNVALEQKQKEEKERLTCTKWEADNGKRVCVCFVNELCNSK